MNLIIHTDGGARGNPGPAAVGVVIEGNGKTIAAFGKRIGEATNNVAEYTAVIEALLFLSQKKPKEDWGPVQFYLDSTLVVNQLNGLFKVKEPQLRTLLVRIRTLEGSRSGAIRYSIIPREHNRRADALVNQALDG